MDHSQFTLSRKAARAISQRSLVRVSDTIVVAVSGGADSVALLDYLASRQDLSLHLVVAHLNHSLRGEESDGDEEFVRYLAAGYGVRCECRRTDIASLARERGESLEEAGREARYRFFAEVAGEVGAIATAIAHHMDDQAETVLLRLIRGSGPAGLRGMSHRSADGRYIRPLLEVSRAEIEEYVAARKLRYRTDSSNSDSSFMRNRIRNELIPYLRDYNPAIVRRLADTASIMAADEALLSKTVKRRWEEVGRVAQDHLVLDGAAVSQDSAGMRLRLYRHAIELLKGSLRRISFTHLRDIDRLLAEGPPNGTLDLPDGITVARSYGELTFSQHRNLTVDVIEEMVIASFGTYELSTGLRISVEPCSGPVPVSERGESELVVDLSELPFPWVVRGYLHGDRISPRGMTGHKKIKDLFIDEKIPQRSRSEIPLFFSGGTLFWVAGVRRGGNAVAGVREMADMARVELLEFTSDTGILP